MTAPMSRRLVRRIFRPAAGSARMRLLRRAVRSAPVRDAGRPLLVIGTCGVVIAGIAAAGAHRGYPTARVPLRGGAAWLASNQVGQLTLVDGSSAEVAARVTVSRPASPLTAIQEGMTGYALDRWDGSIVRVDPATLRADHHDALLPGYADGGYQAVVGFRSLYALDGVRGRLTAADAGSLDVRARSISLPARAAAEHAVVDGGGRLWLLDPGTGDLVWYADGRVHTRAAASTAGDAVLTTVGGRPVVVDVARRRADLLDASSGASRRSLSLDLHRDDVVSVSGSVHADELYVVVNSRRLLLVCRFGSGSCRPPVHLGGGGEGRGPAAPAPVPPPAPATTGVLPAPPTLRSGALLEPPAPPPVAPHEALAGSNAPGLGAAVESPTRLLVPDFSTGRVWMVDRSALQVVGKPDIFGHGLRFELLARDGVVFYNDPNSDQAGVIDPDGRVRRVSKYRAVIPGRSGGASPGPGAGPTATSTPTPTRTSQPAGRGGRVSIVVRPGMRGTTGERFELTAVAVGHDRITTADWTFGDGARGSGSEVRHAWAHPGRFPVHVAATLRSGGNASASVTITIGDRADTPQITGIVISPANPRVHQDVRFSARVRGPAPRHWAWRVVRLGTATVVATSSASGFSRRLDVAGEYEATLRVDAGSASDSRSLDFSVKPPGAGLRCGDTITHDVALTADLRCPGGALTVGASHVTLDLNGHRLLGPGKGTGVTIASQSGAPVSDVTVRNGTITGFTVGVGGNNGRGITLTGLHLRDNANPDLEIFPQGAVWVDSTRGLTIADCVISGSAFVVGPGQDNSEVTLTGSTVSGLTLPDGSHVDPLIYLNAGSSSVTGNRLTDYVIIDEADDVTIADNPVMTKGWIDISGPNATVRGNHITDSTHEYAISVSGPAARITGNTVARNPGVGVWIHRFTEARQAEISGNTLSDNGSAGLLARSDVFGDGGLVASVAANIVTGNGHHPDRSAPDVDDGLYIDALAGSQIEIRDNHTANNADYGIEAHGAVEDGHGNTSVGQPHGCLGVICTPG